MGSKRYERGRLEPARELVSFCEQRPMIVGALILYCGRADVAEELAQDALALACNKWSRIQKMEMPGAWLHRVALNLANSYFRRKAAERRAKARMGSEPLTYLDQDVAAYADVRAAIASFQAGNGLLSSFDTTRIFQSPK